MPETNDTLLKEIRETYDYYRERWDDIYAEGATDMRYLSGDPWDAQEKAARKDKLPALAFDELNQYLNQLINDVRQNKRAIRVIPKGSGSNDKSAELRGDLLRQIEYDSRAQAAYENAFEGGASRGYGFAGWRKRYVNDRSFDQELQIRRFPNPDAVMLDYDAKEWDCSDGLGAFVLDLIPKVQFTRRYKKATVTDFAEATIAQAPNWFRGSAVQVAEYWKVKLSTRKLLLFEVPKVGPVTIYQDEFRGSSIEGQVKGDPKDQRDVEQRKVCQYITNGLEVLEESNWDGKYIPIAPCWGREMWLSEGSGSKRVMMSLVRLARDPYMAYCYLRTNEIIEARMTPKVPFIGYKGQFHNPQEWQNSMTEPLAFLQVNPMTDVSGGQIMPIPTRAQFQPNFESYEVACEAMRRAIQASMGKYNVSVGKNDSSVHSGTQQKALDAQSDQGSYHYIDNYERFLECMGRIGDDLLDYTYDTARDVGTRKLDDSYHVTRINDPKYTNPKTQKVEHLSLGIGDHGVTIATGPSFESQREAAGDFADTIWREIEQLPLDPATKGKFLALLVKLRNLGPLGDQMAELLAPEQGNPQQALAQAQQNAQQQQMLIAELNAELQKLKLEKAGKIIQGQFEERMAAFEQQVKVLVAEIGTKAQAESERAEQYSGFMSEIRQMFHERAMQASDQQHEKELAAQNAQQQAQQVEQPAA